MTIRRIILLSLMPLIVNCTSTNKGEQEASLGSTSKHVFNYSNKDELAAYMALNLDSTHANLLNPQISKESYQEVVQAWVKLHADIGTYLSENNFIWNSTDTAIRVVHKIYFNPDGQITKHFFNVLTPSVTDSTKVVFSELLTQFDASYQVNIIRNIPFAQCGKTQYTNL